MLIDLNAYVGHWPFVRLRDNSCQDLVRRMDRFGVDVSVVSNLNGVFYKNTQSANEELRDEIRSERKFADRIVPFAVVNPIYAGWRGDLDQCLGSWGMQGVRIHPQYHDYALNDPACVELMKRVRDRGVPLALSLRMVDSRQRSWLDVAPEWSLKDAIFVLRTVPGIRLLILNVANGAILDAEDTAELQKADVLMDTSGRALNDLGAMLARYGRGKFGFGTHAPLLDSLTGLLRIEAIPELQADKKVKERLRSGNAKEFLKF